MRVFQTMDEAASEIERDIFKGPSVTSTRVQNLENRELQGSERFGYLYSVHEFPGDIETSSRPRSISKAVREFVDWAKDQGFPLYVEHPEKMEAWLHAELRNRLWPEYYLGRAAPDHLNPALEKVAEGEHFSYTYRERLVGMREMMVSVLHKNPDSRRAYWPIFRHNDVLRAAEPTRIPCSISYQALIRKVAGESKLLWVYHERSMDYTNFWPSDLWLARQLQLQLVDALHELDVVPGAVIHFVTSAHSFHAAGTEIY